VLRALRAEASCHVFFLNAKEINKPMADVGGLSCMPVQLLNTFNLGH
jgi:hypothetical protein